MSSVEITSSRTPRRPRGSSRSGSRSRRAPAAHIVLTGGSTPRRAYEIAAELEPDWSRVELWWGDERCVPPDDERSNYGMAKEALLDRLERQPAAVHRMQGELGRDAGADDYEHELDGVGTFDLAPSRPRPRRTRRVALPELPDARRHRPRRRRLEGRTRAVRRPDHDDAAAARATRRSCSSSSRARTRRTRSRAHSPASRRSRRPAASRAPDRGRRRAPCSTAQRPRSSRSGRASRRARRARARCRAPGRPRGTRRALERAPDSRDGRARTHRRRAAASAPSAAATSARKVVVERRGEQRRLLVAAEHEQRERTGVAADRRLRLRSARVERPARGRRSASSPGDEQRLHRADRPPPRVGRRARRPSSRDTAPPTAAATPPLPRGRPP